MGDRNGKQRTPLCSLKLRAACPLYAEEDFSQVQYVKDFTSEEILLGRATLSVR